MLRIEALCQLNQAQVLRIPLSILCSMFIWARKCCSEYFYRLVVYRIALKPQSHSVSVDLYRFSYLGHGCMFQHVAFCAQPHLIHILPHIWNSAQGLGNGRYWNAKCKLESLWERIWDQSQMRAREWKRCIDYDRLSHVCWIHHGGSYWGRHLVLYCTTTQRQTYTVYMGVYSSMGTFRDV